MATTKAYSLILVSIVASFIGFSVENIFIAWNHGFMDNRNMVLPFLYGYGLAMILYNVLFGTPNEPLLFGQPISFSSNVTATIYSFTMAFLGVCIGEIIVGYMTQWCCNIIWWDYSEIPLHITRYTSIPTSAGFAFLITLFMKYCFDPLMSFFSKLHPNALSFLATALLLVLVLDMVNSGIHMFRYNDTLHIWRIDFENR